jgi:hypothetical protein
MNVWIRKGGRRKGSVRWEGYEGEEALWKEIIIFQGSLGFAGSEFEFYSQEGSLRGAPVCWGFWAWGPGYPYGILELGSCPS